jgi:hypothetical protein
MTDSIHALALALADIAAELEAMPLEKALEIIAAVAELADLAEPGYLGQVAAAAGAAWRLAPALTGTHAPESSAGTAATGPQLAPVGALEALAVWYAGQGHVCLHDPSIRRPRSVEAAAWRPGLLVCTACTMLLAVHDPIANATCDGCGLSARTAHLPGGGLRALLSRLAGEAGGDSVIDTIQGVGPAVSHRDLRIPA